MIGGEVKGNAGAECNGYPRQQAAGTGFGACPCTQGLDQWRPERGT